MKIDVWMIPVMMMIMVSSMEAATTADTASKYTAMYIFGDSLIDNGNNINFPDSLAKANYLPYGIDFPTGPTGRFCNGKIIVDFIAEMMGLPLIPSYADKSANTQYGVNYASAGAGILNDTGRYFGRVIPLSEQISNFKKTLSEQRKRAQEKQVSKHLENALVFLDMGANDYLNNYLRRGLYPSSLIYTPKEFADLLTKLLRQHVLEIQGLGLRKFLIAEASPIGCAPVEVRDGECRSSANNMVEMFNLRLGPLVRSLESEFPGSAFMLSPSFQVFAHLRDNAEAYGFKVRIKAVVERVRMEEQNLCVYEARLHVRIEMSISSGILLTLLKQPTEFSFVSFTTLPDGNNNTNQSVFNYYHS